jgi:hypothetical protein
MKRHVVAGRYGPEDRTSIQVDGDEQLTELQLIIGDRTLDHGIGAALTSLKALGVHPSEMGIDLAVVAAHVHAADTRISRAHESQDSWTREVRLVIPVHDPDTWSAATGTLTTLLNFLTGDRWALQFRGRSERFATLVQPNRQFDRLRVDMVFPVGLVKDVESENSTRGRSFLFIALGALAGTGLADGFTLRVPENGLIALNVPLDPLRLGSNSTRTTHPFYLARWNDLLVQLGVAGRVENPYWSMTKGEMVRECESEAALREIASSSLSCAHPASARWQGLQGRGIEHCGYCLPCLIRRAALEHAWGRGGDNTSYTEADLHAHVLDTSQSIGQQVRSFQYAIARIQANPDIARLLVHKPGSLVDVMADEEQWAAVYRRGLSEVGDLIAGVRTAPA